MTRNNENNSAIGRSEDALAFLDSLLTPEEIAESGLMAAEIGKEILTLEQLFEEYDGDNYKPEEIDWGKPRGKEIW